MDVPPNACFVLVNNGAGDDVTPELLTNIAAAVDYALLHCFGPVWGGAYSCRPDLPEMRASLPGPARVVSLEARSDVADAAGYHTDAVIRCFRDDLPSLTTGAFSFPVVISHEIFEVAGDPGCNQWVDRGDGNEIARELSDTVEGFCFCPVPQGRPGAGISISDFLLPSFFDPSGLAPYSFCNKPTAPFALPSDSGANYQIVRSVNERGARQVQAMGQIHSGRLLAKSHASSRSSKRGLWLPSSPLHLGTR